jgi:phage tail-like protein
MAIASRIDPFRTFNFRLEIDGLTVGSFRECSGLAADGNAVEYREGTDVPRSVRKLIGLQTYSNVTLKRGQTTNPELWNWYRNIVNGLPDRRHGSVILMDEQRKDVMRWSIENMWIKKIEAPSFNATANEVAVESVELVHEGLMLEQ